MGEDLLPDITVIWTGETKHTSIITVFTVYLFIWFVIFSFIFSFMYLFIYLFVVFMFFLFVFFNNKCILDGGCKKIVFYICLIKYDI